ncbi:MAG TPA: glutathione S-transferase C-terminal domain-containing protein, partial [Burkholderiaceae bacterium]|nr:glutathione S-transferase C-terminal domain-containing protein [Burkholderiaceae bacterium]
RSVCAEMHAGFGALRGHLGMNIEASLPEVGARVLAEQPQVRDDIARIVAMWGELLEQHGGPMLFGAFGIADAFFAPVVTRLRTYGVSVPAPIAAYIERVLALPGVAAWIAGALAEHDFLAFEEAYRTQR